MEYGRRSHQHQHAGLSILRPRAPITVFILQPNALPAVGVASRGIFIRSVAGMCYPMLLPNRIAEKVEQVRESYF